MKLSRPFIFSFVFRYLLRYIYSLDTITLFPKTRPLGLSGPPGEGLGSTLSINPASTRSACKLLRLWYSFPWLSPWQRKHLSVIMRPHRLTVMSWSERTGWVRILLLVFPVALHAFLTSRDVNSPLTFRWVRPSCQDHGNLYCDTLQEATRSPHCNTYPSARGIRNLYNIYLAQR